MAELKWTPGPDGVLTATVRMEKDEKAFFNGYQTWTYCPEVGRFDRQRGLNGLPKPMVDFFSLDRYGDYHFMRYPNRPGRFHGFSYCYFRRGDFYRLIASLDEKPGYTVFTYDAAVSTLTVRRDCAPGPQVPPDLYYAEGTEAEVFDGWFAALGITPRTVQPLKGYSSWYDKYDDIDKTIILEALEGCAQVMEPGDLFQIDDGWELAVGDWEPDLEKFPGGLKPLVDAAHEKGFLAGLWLAPFVCEKDSAIYQNHPDWLFRVNGKPWRCGCNWSGFYALDIDHPEVQDYLEKTFRTVLEEWGFDLVKLDFLYGGAPFGRGQESRAGRMTRGMELLRKWCGDKLILGCGVPVMPAFGLVDYCRVSCDVSLDWDDKWIMRRCHRERVSTRQAIANTIFRRQLNGRAYGSDPDVFFLREENLDLTDTQKELLGTVNALFGSVLLTSDDPGKYSPEQRERYRALADLRRAENVEVNADNGLRVSWTLGGERKELKVF